MDFAILKNRAIQFQARVAAAQDHLKSLSENLEKVRSTRRDVSGAHLFLQHLAEKLNEHNESQAAKLATLALQEVFYDLQLSLEVEHTSMRGVPGSILRIRDSEKGAVGEPSEAFGGGPGSILGVVLRVVTVVRQQGLSRILILDEPMIHVSERYQPEAARLLRKLCEPESKGGLGFDMLVITHEPIFKTSAHKSYHAEKSEDGSRLKIVEGSGDE